MLRSLSAAGLLTLAASPALAGGGGCVGDCYRQSYAPPVYKTYAEKVMVRAPRTYAMVTPAEYGVVHEKVMVHPGGRHWSVSYDRHGRKVGCWVTTPAKYASVSRTVMIRAPEAVPYAVPAQYGIRTHTFMVQGPTKTWEPIGRGYGGGYGHGGYGHGGGYGRRASFGGYGHGGGLVGGAAGIASGAVGAGLGIAGGALGLGGGYDGEEY